MSHDRFYDSLDSIKAYKGEYYSDINTLLRSNTPLDDMPPLLRRHIENIDSKMKKGDRNITLYRGVKGLHNFLNYYESNSGSPTLIELAFCSSSKKLQVVQKEFVDKNGCCVLAFTLPPNIKRYDFQDDRYEAEVLIQRNVQFILESDEPVIDKSRNLQIYSAVVKPYDPPLITKKDEKLLDQTHNEIALEIQQEENKEDLDDIAKELYNDLNDESFGNIIKDQDIDEMIDRYNWTQNKKDIIKTKIINLINLNMPIDDD